MAVYVRERNWKKSTNDPSKGLLVTQSERDIDVRRLIQNIFSNLNLVIEKRTSKTVDFLKYIRDSDIK